MIRLISDLYNITVVLFLLSLSFNHYPASILLSLLASNINAAAKSHRHQPETPTSVFSPSESSDCYPFNSLYIMLLQSTPIESNPIPYNPDQICFWTDLFRSADDLLFCSDYLLRL